MYHFPRTQQEILARISALKPLDSEQSVSFEGSSQQGVGSSEEIIIRQLPQVKEGKREVKEEEDLPSSPLSVASKVNIDTEESEKDTTAHCPLPTPSVTDADGKKYKTYTRNLPKKYPFTIPSPKKNHKKLSVSTLFVTEINFFCFLSYSGKILLREIG